MELSVGVVVRFGSNKPSTMSDEGAFDLCEGVSGHSAPGPRILGRAFRDCGPR